MLIVGLGNPGKDYENTRHNIGFMIVDAITTMIAPTMRYSYRRKFYADIIEITRNNTKLIFAKPQTYMNGSGKSVASIVDFYRLKPEEDVMVLLDDKDLDFGTIRLRFQGGDAGQKGLRSIQQCLGTTSLKRLRFGIKNDFTSSQAAVDFVLSSFSWREKEILSQCIHTSCQAVLHVIDYGFVSAMNTYNQLAKFRTNVTVDSG